MYNGGEAADQMVSYSFKGGEVLEQITGAVSKSSIKEMISQKAL